MTLKIYRKKRNFNISPEPNAIKKNSSSMNFCVQKHHATRLHYDFRIEFQGVLLSWAIPKGPSMNPQDKRLAIKVEDHPLDYQYFEGVIPKGNYGAGTVEIWDHGSYTLPDADQRKEMEKKIAVRLKKGHLEIVLNGSQLQGSFIFQKLNKNDKDDNSWLLIKKNDGYAPIVKKKNENVEKQRKRLIPDFIPPMLATLIDKPFNNENWIFEIKWDGYRALAFVNNNKIELKSRNNINLSSKFPSIIKELVKFEEQVILDGELVVLDSNGRSDFQLMQNYQTQGNGSLYYYIFDILFKNGEDLRELPLLERKTILETMVKKLPLARIRYSKYVLEKGKSLFSETVEHKLEGIIGKNLFSTYQSRRSKDWVKIKTIRTHEVVIGGFTAPRGSRKQIGALIVGIYNEEHELCFVGHVGGGFTEQNIEDVMKKLKPLIQKKSPFKILPSTNAPVTWVKPKLVCEVSFSEWTKDNHLRQPIFQGLRIDKDPGSIKMEIPQSISAMTPTKTINSKKELILTNLDKIYWPNEKYTKGDLIKYYKEIAKYIVPYIKNRPVMLHRFPDGIQGEGFYQKNISDPLPKGIKTFPIKHNEKTDKYLLINNIKSLLFAINLGSIDIHPFLAKISNLDKPDFCVIDLDPHDISFKYVVEIALTFHELLKKIGVNHYCKTSGGKGLHILIPLKGKYSFEQSRQFAEIISHLVHNRLPKITSLERSSEKRPNKIYLDCLQNRNGQTIAAPYCVRPRPKALVSTPLEWNEVNEDLDPANYNMMTIPKRLNEKGDFLEGLLKKGINLKKALENIDVRP